MRTRQPESCLSPRPRKQPTRVLRSTFVLLIVTCVAVACSDGDSTPAQCGNGVVDEGEVCDGTNLAGRDCASVGQTKGTLACNATCDGLDESGCSTCGNGILEADEVCDTTELDGETCAGFGHAGGTLACAETCDDFDESACTGCGDAMAEGEEVCDGADVRGQTCEGLGYTAGTLGCSVTCDALDESACTTCGDDTAEVGELCDGPDLAGATCESLGHAGGTLACNSTCDDHDVSECYICGNARIDPNEDCDGTKLPMDVSCTSLGYEGGILACDSSCSYDTSDCSICGDGIRQGAEQCDGLDFGGQTCASLGFDGGNLGCNLAQCQFSYSGCSGGMYTQDFESGVMPPEFSVDVVSPWTVSNVMPINGTFSARSGSFAAGVGGITNLTLQATFPVAGSISFVHRESCANGIDFLEFYVDGVFQQSWSGITAAATLNLPVAAGNHTFVWRFNRAGFLDKGSNAVWVDDIILSGGVPL